MTVLSPPLASQVPLVTLDGRVVVRGDTAGIPGATVELAGVLRVTTDSRGYFRFEGLDPGRYSIVFKAFAYRTETVSVLAQQDTTLLVELDAVPFILDTMEVVGRTVTVRGEVYDQASDRPVIDAEVTVTPELQAFTDMIGRFKISDVFAGPTLGISVRAFGFLPVVTTFAAEHDTTLVFELEPDPMVQQMVDRQVTRLEERAGGRLWPSMPPINREELVKWRFGTLDGLVAYQYGLRLRGRGFRCVLLDDVQLSWERVSHLLTARLARVEVLFRGQMLRVYTVDYLRRMMGSGVTLQPPYFLGVRGRPYCR